MKRLLPVVEVRGVKSLGIPVLSEDSEVPELVRRLLLDSVAVSVQVRDGRLGIWSHLRWERLTGAKECDRVEVTQEGMRCID